MKILLLFDVDFEINKNRICDFLNNKTTHLKFVNGGDINIDSDIISKPDSFISILNKINKKIHEFDKIFCFTEKQYIDNYFFHEYKKLSIFSFWGWIYLTDLSKNNGLLYFIVDYLSLYIDDIDFRHKITTGCIYDFLQNKTGIDDGMRQARICPTCLERISNNLSSPEQINILEDLKILMNFLSDSSKWNQDILDLVIPQHQSIKKRKSKKSGEINVVIASPSDAWLERKNLLEKLEIQFRRGHHESYCCKRLIVHDWEDLASQPGYPQDIINRQIICNVDFVVAIFKYKLGTPTIDIATNQERSVSGTAEELLTSLNNSMADKPLGMAYFYSKAPSVSVDLDDLEIIKNDWDNLQKFKKDIQNKILYKPYTETGDLLQIIISDLEKNIIDYFE